MSRVITVSPEARVLFRQARGAQKRALLDLVFARLDKEAKRAAGRAIRIATQRLRTRSGDLRRSIQGIATEVNGAPAVQIGIYEGPSLVYALAQEEGAEIRPKDAKALAIPTEEGGALTPAGVPRFDGPRDFPEPLQLVRYPGDDERGAFAGLYRVSDLEKPDVTLREIDAVYVLLHKVQIKPKYFLRDGMFESLRAIGAAVSDEIVGFLTGEGARA